MTEHTNEHLELLEQLFPTDIRRTIGKTVARIGVAGDAITEAQERDPANAERYHAAFKLLKPTDSLISDLLYIRHCREMLTRVAQAEDTRPGTDAEVMGAMSIVTQAAPPGRVLSLAYARMFRRVFPEYEQEAADLESSQGREHVAGEVDKAIAEFRSKLSVPDRVLKEE